MKTQYKQQGFTLVELLIVIVVIAILAAITLISYNGIQNRAMNASIVSSASSWEHALKAYEAANGSYPPRSYPDGYTVVCLATELPATSDFPAGKCGQGSIDDSFNAALQSVATIHANQAYPTQTLKIGRAPSKIRGILYSTTWGIVTQPDGSTITPANAIWYVLDGANADCGSGQQTTTVGNSGLSEPTSHTGCVIVLDDTVN